MRIKSIKLDNIRSYDNERVEFDNGLMLLYGENGAGKSSLLSSIFFGLYLSDVLSHIDEDVNLDSIVRKTEGEGIVSLTFEINGDEYEVEWAISVIEKDGERKASTKSCVLTGDNLDEPIEGVRAVRDTIEDIIGMSPESFVNSVYVQQGNISRVVKADGDERKKIVDGLLGLSRLDTYIERMDKARREIGAQKRTLEELQKEKNRQLQTIEDETVIEDDLKEIQEEKKEAENKKETVEKRLEEVRDEKRNITSKIEEYSSLEEEYMQAKEELEEVKERRDKLDKKKKDAEQEAKTIDSELETVKNRVTEACDDLGVDNDEAQVRNLLNIVEGEISSTEKELTKMEEGKLKTLTGEVEQHNGRIEELEDKVSTQQNDLRKLESQIQNCESKIEEIQESLDKMNNLRDIKFGKIDDLCEKLNLQYETLDGLQSDVVPEARENVVERVSQTYEELGAKKKTIEYYTQLDQDNICPICGREHDDIESSIVEHLEESEDDLDTLEDSASAIDSNQENLDELDKLASSLQNIESKIDAKSSQLEDKKQRLNELEERKNNIEESVENARSEIDELESVIDSKEQEVNNLESELVDMRSQLEAKNKRLSSIEQILGQFETINELEEEIESKEDEAEKNEELRQNIQRNFIQKKQEVEELSEKYEKTDISGLKEDLESKKSSLERARGLIEDSEHKTSRYQERIAEKKQELSRVKELKSRRAGLEDQKVQIAEQESDAEEVIASYESVKSQLRQENLGLLNKYSNDVFQSMYSNKIYQRMEIDADYNITLITGDDVRVSPEDLSGGEMTLVSLAIRAGVYKLLVERQGSADTLPPFILDEPTTFLDEEHVSNLQNMIEKINSWDVPQVFIVSHREDMIQNADSAYEVGKDAATETSEVTKKY